MRIDIGDTEAGFLWDNKAGDTHKILVPNLGDDEVDLPSEISDDKMLDILTFLLPLRVYGDLRCGVHKGGVTFHLYLVLHIW
jgi:hypothetical protein